MKKGFTLIELLAVIVILAIIALIATPIILGVVENARKSAAGSSALGYIDAVEKEIALGGFDETVYPTGKIDIKSVAPYDKIEVQGSLPSEGTLYVLDDYRIAASVLCVNDYRVVSINHKIDSIKKDCDDMDILIDYSGNKNYGYLRNGAIRNDTSVTTDGVDDYIYAGLAGHEFKDEFSIAIRVNVKNYFNEYDQDMFENIESGGIGLAIERQYFKFNLYSKSKKMFIEFRDTNIVNLNEWYTVVGTFKDNMMHLYVNGKEASNGLSFSADDMKNSTLPFIIGANPNSCNATLPTCTVIGEPSNIEFTDALIFDRALSEEEIQKEFSGKITNISNKSKMLLRYDLDM